MSKTTRLQINVPVKVKEQFEKSAAEYGMDVSSAIRFMMIKFNLGDVEPAIISSPNKEKLSPKAAARYDKMAKEAQDGKNVSKAFDDVEEMLDYLHSSPLDE